ncbi:MAG: DUF5724 domain-containing protein [Planctomycetota bacterium]
MTAADLQGDAEPRSALWRRVGAATSLPNDLRRLLWKALGRFSVDGKHLERQDELAKRIAGFTAAERGRLFAVLWPELAPALERAWSSLGGRPRSRGSHSLPFRYPGDPLAIASTGVGMIASLVGLLDEFEGDVVELAVRTGRIGPESDAVGWLLAGALDANEASAEEVFAVLEATAEGLHEVAVMGAPVLHALMGSGREDAGAIVERLLLEAGREEGLRRAVFEAASQASPVVFRRALRLVLERDLLRFSSVLQISNHWFDFHWSVAEAPRMRRALELVLRFLEEPQAREAALASDDAEVVYLALWTFAFEDVETAVAPASRLAACDDVERRFAATHLLAQLEWSDALPVLLERLDDENLRIAAHAQLCFRKDTAEWVDPLRVFDALARLKARLKKEKTVLPALVWSWWKLEVLRSDVARSMERHSRHGDHPRCMLEHVRDLDPDDRGRFVRGLGDVARVGGSGTAKAARRAIARPERQVVIDMLGDASSLARNAAALALGATPVDESEIETLVGLLGRKTGEVRSLALDRLARLERGPTLDLARRLLGEKSAPRRHAGLELLRRGLAESRLDADARALALDYRSGRELDPEEVAHLEAILAAAPAEIAGDAPDLPSRADAFGLVSPSDRRSWPAFGPRPVVLRSEAADRCIDSLARLMFEHGGTEFETGFGTMTLLEYCRELDDAEPDPRSLPLEDLWRTWERERGPELRDDDGLELLRARLFPHEEKPWRERLGMAEDDEAWTRVPRLDVFQLVLDRCLAWQASEGVFDLLLDDLEDRLNDVAPEIWSRIERLPWHIPLATPDSILLRLRRIRDARTTLDLVRTRGPDLHRPAHARRTYALKRRAMWESGGHHFFVPELADFLRAKEAGAFGEEGAAEFIDLLVGPVASVDGSSLLHRVSSRRPPTAIAPHAELIAAVDRVRRRLVAIECARGDGETAASAFCLELVWTGGLEALTAALDALGGEPLSRATTGRTLERSRAEMLARIVARSAPRDDDDPSAFAAWARSSGLPTVRLVELAAFAPQWASFVEAALEWPGLGSAVWWIHAHTRGGADHLEASREEWAASIAERTPLAASELEDGAVDVRWFTEARTLLGAERWAEVHEAARFASSRAGDRRACLFASAMLGEVSLEVLGSRIDEKRDPDALRAVGLIPLEPGEGRDAELRRRFLLLERFRRESRRFGAHRRESEGRAFAIAMENLARTAGYEDPTRLRWAMEVEAGRDLAAGPLELERDGVLLRLSLDDDARPVLSLSRGGRALKSIPTRIRKDEDVLELESRVRELREQTVRVRLDLEAAMCRGDAFTAEELRGLMVHPLLASLLGRLVFVGEEIAGYPNRECLVLRDASGRQEPLRPTERLRIAHPHDLLRRGDWRTWQRECLVRERLQPFKQLFRELYPITETERKQRLESERYAGHQLDVRRAVGVLGSRGWVLRPGEGLGKTDHREGLTAWLVAADDFASPAEIEGVTLRSVVFTRRDQVLPIDLAEVPSILFSETMRDVDLAVSVAHAGGVDPEVSASTLAMRAELLRETCRLLGLDNVVVQTSTAVIRGRFGLYTLHLGHASTSVNGRFFVIRAVPSQHRGRVFLPFADDDPRTAEVLSKALLLARDDRIKDPSVLGRSRVRARGPKPIPSPTTVRVFRRERPSGYPSVMAGETSRDHRRSAHARSRKALVPAWSVPVPGDGSGAVRRRLTLAKLIERVVRIQVREFEVSPGGADSCACSPRRRWPRAASAGRSTRRPQPRVEGRRRARGRDRAPGLRGRSLPRLHRRDRAARPRRAGLGDGRLEARLPAADLPGGRVTGGGGRRTSFRQSLRFETAGSPNLASEE